MKLLITGGAGFIGSNFIHYWLKHHLNDEIVNLDKLTYAGNLDNLKDIEGDKRYHFIKGDIADRQAVVRAMKGVDTVVHFAAESHVDRSIVGPGAFVLTNVLGTQVLLDAALGSQVRRFHHVSTDEVFGALELDSKEKFNENTVYNPRSPYSASKAASDHLVRSYFHTFGLPVTITNCGNNFGPYQYPEKFLARAIINLLYGKKIKIYGDGLYVRDWLYVEDHCRAIELSLEKGKLGETYLIGGLTEDVSNLAAVRKMIDIVRKTTLNPLLNKEGGLIEYVKDRPGHDRRYAVDWSKAKKELGYEPRASFDEYLEKTVEWYRDNEWWWRDLKKEAEEFYFNSQRL